MSTLQCAVGNTIRVGNYVAHISPSDGAISRRRVYNVNADQGFLYLEPLTKNGTRGKVLPHNCVCTA